MSAADRDDLPEWLHACIDDVVACLESMWGFRWQVARDGEAEEDSWIVYVEPVRAMKEGSGSDASGHAPVTIDVKDLLDVFEDGSAPELAVAAHCTDVEFCLSGAYRGHGVLAEIRFAPSEDAPIGVIVHADGSWTGVPLAAEGSA